MVLVDQSIPLSVRSTTSSGARNDLASLPCICQLAKLAIDKPLLLIELGMVVPVDLMNRGYTKPKLVPLYRKMQTLVGTMLLPLAQKVLDAVASEYSALLADPAVLPYARNKTRKLNELFSSAICEAVVREVIDRALLPGQLVCDAHVCMNREGDFSSKNIDFFYFEHQDARVYEAKCNPCSLLEEWWRRNLPGHDYDWRSDKLCLMLDLHDAMTQASWRVRLGCVTIRTKQILAIVTAKGGAPSQLTIFCQEDFGAAFP